MAKKGSKNNPITTDELESIIADERPFIIIEASIKDDFCNYIYEVTKGIGLGDSHKVSGSGLIKDDMRDAFANFNVHLAVIDDVFKHSKIEIKDIDMENGHELTQLFHVTGFKISGSKENESIVLIGNKYVSSAGGRIEIKSPKIPLDNLSSYKWYNELKKAADKARLEVELYKEGKYTAIEEEEEQKPDPRQLKIGEAVEGELGEDNSDDFENAKV